MELITFLLALSFLRYAKHTENININEWLTLINTKRNRVLIIGILILSFVVSALGIRITITN